MDDITAATAPAATHVTDRPTTVHLTDGEVAALRAALGDAPHPGTPPAPLTPEGLDTLRRKLSLTGLGLERLLIADWVSAELFPRGESATAGQLIQWVGELLQEAMWQGFPGQTLFKGDDGAYHTLAPEIALVEAPTGYTRHWLRDGIRWAENEGDGARVRALKGRLAALPEGDGGWPDTRAVRLTSAQAAALSDALGRTPPTARVGGAAGMTPAATGLDALGLETLRAGLARAAVGTGGLRFTAWVYGDELDDVAPCDAGRLAEGVLDCLSDDWHEESSALFLGSDGRHYSLVVRVGVYEECQVFALESVGIEIECAKERGDAARVEALKGHLAALKALAGRAAEGREGVGAAA